MAATTSSDVVVTGVGCVTPVGLTAAQSCAAIRAGITRLTEHPAYICLPEDADSPEAQARMDEDGEPLRAGLVPGLDPELPGNARMQRLALLALQRLFLETGLGRRDLSRTALFVALPLPDPATLPWALKQRFTKELCRRAGVEDWAELDVAEEGPVGVFRLMQKAATLLQGRRVDFAVVLAVDSFVDVERLTLLDEVWRLKNSRTGKARTTPWSSSRAPSSGTRPVLSPWPKNRRRCSMRMSSMASRGSPASGTPRTCACASLGRTWCWWARRMPPEGGPPPMSMWGCGWAP
jgi:hypothetical protein